MSLFHLSEAKYLLIIDRVNSYSILYSVTSSTNLIIIKPISNRDKAMANYTANTFYRLIGIMQMLSLTASQYGMKYGIIIVHFSLSLFTWLICLIDLRQFPTDKMITFVFMICKTMLFIGKRCSFYDCFDTVNQLVSTTHFD